MSCIWTCLQVLKLAKLLKMTYTCLQVMRGKYIDAAAHVLMGY